MSSENADPAEDGAVMTRDARLARRFVALADTLVDDYDVVDLLDRLVTSCVELLDVAAAGLLLSDQRGQLQLVASSSDATRRRRALPARERGGAVPGGRAHRPPGGRGRDPESCAGGGPPSPPRPLRRRSCRCTPAPCGCAQETIGALNLFGTAASAPMAADELRIAQALADVATIAILQQRSLHRASLVAEQLQTALNSRIVIEQAKGVLAESGQLDMDAAFQALRSYARSTSTKLGTVAGRLVRRELAAETILDR